MQLKLVQFLHLSCAFLQSASVKVLLKKENKQMMEL